MNKTRISELLDRYLTDEITDDERKELMELIREGRDEQMIKDRIETMLRNSEVFEGFDTQEPRKMMIKILSAASEQEKVKSIRPQKQNVRWLAMAATVSAIAICSVWFYSKRVTAPQGKIALNEHVSESALFTGKQFVRLPDGSTVLLNEFSKLSYSSSFGKKTRQVTLSGEGYFDVQHDSSRPFLVVTGKITTTVLGTTFNVQAYPDQKEVRVSVINGRVRVGDSERDFGILSKDQQIAVDVATNDFVQTPVDQTTTLWQDRYLILDDVSMEEAAKIIAKKYKMEVVVANALKNCRISATFLDGENLDQVLAVVSGVVKATFEIQSDRVVKIEGKGCD